jgi:hypothetical protein
VGFVRPTTQTHKNLMFARAVKHFNTTNSPQCKINTSGINFVPFVRHFGTILKKQIIFGLPLNTTNLIYFKNPTLKCFKSIEKKKKKTQRIFANLLNPQSIAHH